MATFQSITMSVAIVILIICLIIIAIALYRSKYNTAFPPVVADCPDYWLDMSDGDGSNCVNKMKDLGNPSCPRTMNFSTSMWTGDDGLCRKRTWARKCDLTWDGVTNNANACKTDSSSSSTPSILPGVPTPL